ncbi:hypothetical protein GALMADRAFT_241280 [Galerina marginata CBS 339.88]|uniref:Uncharacterized protein n=1 Tax=Galerina marginata (strain CBS 339.88) TaxID=685588 RepID=A0A067TPD1_GALM3|nr:hypothetical protein GALMADRAFT_241280 [Galerina marginata CBS 339.88]
MVKRPKSPEIVEDARYFTVYQPYPLNANWIIEEEQMHCAMWVAECIGLNHLWAIHHKPKARGMILLEISKAYTDHGNFLGEHRWADMLKEPSDEEKQSVSQVFHSFYAKGRDAQKDGWKVLPVKNKWFKDWAPGKGRIKQPYPATHWCAVPVEDRTNKPLCRPLPVEAKPPPPRNHLPVVGSSKWVEKQVESPTTYAGLSNAWANKLPTIDTSKRSGPPMSRTSSVQSPSALSPQSAGPSPATGLGNGVNGRPAGIKSPPFIAPSKSAWGKPVPLKTFTAPENKASKPSWAPVQSAPSASLAEPAPQGPVNAWAKALKIPPSEGPPKATSTSSSGNNSPWAQNAPLTPASPWGQPSALSPVTASAPPTSKSHAQPDNAPKKEKGKVKVSNPPQNGGKPAGQRATPAESATKGKQPEGKLIWSDEPVDIPTTSVAVAEVGFEGEDETFESLENEILSPWETKAQVDYWGAPPPGLGNGEQGKNKGKGVEGKNGKPTPASAGLGQAWGSRGGKAAGGQGGDKSRKPATHGQNQKGRGAQPSSSSKWGDTPMDDWKTEPSASNSWGDMALTLGSGDADEEPVDWQVEVSESNSWGDKPLTVGGAQAEGGMGGPSGVPDVDVDWGGEPMAHGDGDAQEWTPETTTWEDLWVEDANERPPELICPTHNIACKKGICRDMARLVREQERKKREEQWAEQRARGKGRGRGRGRGNGTWRGRGGHNRGQSTEVDDWGNPVENGEGEVDDDGFTTTRKTRRSKKKEPSFIGRMRGFEEEPQAAETQPAKAGGSAVPKVEATAGTSANATEENEDTEDANEGDGQNDGEIENKWSAEDDDYYD